MYESHNNAMKKGLKGEDRISLGTTARSETHSSGSGNINTVQRRRSFLAPHGGNQAYLLHLLLLGIPHTAKKRESYPAIFKWGVAKKKRVCFFLIYFP